MEITKDTSLNMEEEQNIVSASKYLLKNREYAATIWELSLAQATLSMIQGAESQKVAGMQVGGKGKFGFTPVSSDEMITMMTTVSLLLLHFAEA